MKQRRTAVAPVLVLTAGLFLGGWFLQQGVGQEQSLYFQSRVFQEVIDHVAERYVDPVDREALYQDAIDGVLKQLGDPNTSFLDAQNWENFRIRTEGEYGGVGLEIVDREGWVTVVSPIPGTPGARAGIRAGDRFVEVDGQSAEGWTSDQAVERLRGRPGTDVQIRMGRPGVEDPIPFTIRREVIQLKSVPFATMLEDGIGYVPLRIFSESSETEIRAAITGLQREGMERLIVDLRGNLGGLLDQGVALTDLFLAPGLPVVETRGRSPEQNGTLRTSRPEAYPDLPVVVIIDETSASASEIVAGALQDHDRALVVGATSFGKGSVQTLFRLTGGNVLRLTTARWYTPSGRSIQKPFDEQLSLGEHGVLTLAGRLSERPDTLGKERVTSMGGRSLLAGGGITPDLVVLPDTLSSIEQSAVRTVYQQAGALYTAVFNYAVRYLQENPGLSEGFVLPESSMEAFYMALKGAEVDVAREVYDQASRHIRYLLEQEIALQGWGESGQFLHATARDRVLQQAMDVLRGVDSPESLFSRAGEVLPPVQGEEQDAASATPVIPEGRVEPGSAVPARRGRVAG